MRFHNKLVCYVFLAILTTNLQDFIKAETLENQQIDENQEKIIINKETDSNSFSSSEIDKKDVNSEKLSTLDNIQPINSVANELKDSLVGEDSLQSEQISYEIIYENIDETNKVANEDDENKEDSNKESNNLEDEEQLRSIELVSKNGEKFIEDLNNNAVKENSKNKESFDNHKADLDQDASDEDTSEIKRENFFDSDPKPDEESVSSPHLEANKDEEDTFEIKRENFFDSDPEPGEESVSSPHLEANKDEEANKVDEDLNDLAKDDVFELESVNDGNSDPLLQLREKFQDEEQEDETTLKTNPEKQSDSFSEPSEESKQVVQEPNKDFKSEHSVHTSEKSETSKQKHSSKTIDKNEDRIQYDNLDEIRKHVKNLKVMQIVTNENGETTLEELTDAKLDSSFGKQQEYKLEFDHFAEKRSEDEFKEVEEKPLSEDEKLYHRGISYINSTNSITTIMRGYQILQEASKLGNSDAEVEIAFASLLGLYRPMEHVVARQILEKHVKNGHSKAQALLGFMYASGIGVDANQASALLHWTFASMGQSKMAKMMLGYRYWGGIGVKKSCEKALSLYKSVASQVASRISANDGLLIVKVRLQEELDNPGQTQGVLDDDLLQYYNFIADKGDASAQVMLGQLNYQGGRGVERDHSKALEYFKRAADGGNSNAQAYIGKIYAEGSETIQKDDKKAFDYFKLSADQGNPVGQAGVGLFYKQGRSVKQDFDSAAKYFKLSADQGWPEGQLHLGMLYFQGNGRPRDYKQAFQLFSVAAQNGHLLSLYYLAEMHALGIGVARSCTIAVEFYKSVCERGPHILLFEQAYQKYKNLNIESSFAIYSLLAEMGHEVAQSNVAFMLDKGILENVALNWSDAKALQMWKRSAHQGYINSRIKLGDYHYYGRGTPVDYEAAASHYKTAGDQHNSAQAYFNLGYMHEQGLGFERDIHLAKRHYDLASEASADAFAPVTIALAKIAFLFAFEVLEKQAWLSAINLPFLKNTLIKYWDIYLMTILALIMGALVMFNQRRRNLER